MDLSKFSDNRLKELMTINSLINIYGALYQEEQEKVSREFYIYAIKLAMIQANEIFKGDIKLNTQFKNHFEKISEGLFKSKLEALEDRLKLRDSEDDLEDENES